MPSHDVGSVEDLMLYRLAKSLRCLTSARRALEEGDFENSVDRSYYAMFHAINAVHSLDGRGFKSHGEAIGSFNAEYIRFEKIPREFGRELTKAMALRHYSEYEDFSLPDKEKTKHQLEVAEEFVACVRSYIETERLGHKIPDDALKV